MKSLMCASLVSMILSFEAPGDRGGGGQRAAPAEPLRDDGPTLEEYEKAGYKAAGYPPHGYAAKASPRYTEYMNSLRQPPPEWAPGPGLVPKLGDQVVQDPSLAPVQDPAPAELTRLAKAREALDVAQAELDAAQAEVDAAKAEESQPLPWDPANPAILLEDGRVIDCPVLLDEPERLRGRIRQFTQSGAVFHHVADVVEAGGYVRWVYRQDTP